MLLTTVGATDGQAVVALRALADGFDPKLPMSFSASISSLPEFLDFSRVGLDNFSSLIQFGKWVLGNRGTLNKRLMAG